MEDRKYTLDEVKNFCDVYYSSKLVEEGIDGPRGDSFLGGSCVRDIIEKLENLPYDVVESFSLKYSISDLKNMIEEADNQRKLESEIMNMNFFDVLKDVVKHVKDKYQKKKQRTLAGELSLLEDQTEGGALSLTED